MEASNRTRSSHKNDILKSKRQSKLAKEMTLKKEEEDKEEEEHCMALLAECLLTKNTSSLSDYLQKESNTSPRLTALLKAIVHHLITIHEVRKDPSSSSSSSLLLLLLLFLLLLSSSFFFFFFCFFFFFLFFFFSFSSPFLTLLIIIAPLILSFVSYRFI